MIHTTIYLLIINYVSLYVMGLDRYNSLVAGSRARFDLLYVLCLLGGGPSLLVVLLAWRKPAVKMTSVISQKTYRYFIIWSVVIMFLQYNIIVGNNS
jgi:uncharacterized membrane protein YsdA (DUF1294 family)